MLDGLYKAKIDRFWNILGRGLVLTGLTPNQITLIGLVLVLLNCAAYLLHHDTVLFGALLVIAFAFDGLDGAVARLTNSSSRFGGYFDAIVDRYQEVLVLLAVAWVEGFWFPCFLAATGSLLISYNKARTAVEIAIDNDRWPDLLERMERIIVLCALLIAAPLVSLPPPFEAGLLFYGLWVFAGLVHFTAVQRFFRARRLLVARDTDRGP